MVSDLLILAAFFFIPKMTSNKATDSNIVITNGIAVFPFDVKGGPNILYNVKSIVDLISSQIDEIPSLSSVKPKVLIRRLSTEISIVRNPEFLYIQLK